MKSLTSKRALKNARLAFFVILSLLLAACGKSQELSEYLTRDYETMVGEFKSLGGIKVHEKITHLFETEEGEILYAFSDRYDLDTEGYLGGKAEAYGVVSAYEELDKPLFEVKRITEATEEEEESEEITDVAYQDPDLGFSFSYPSNWTLEDAENSITLKAPALEEESQEEDYIYITKLDVSLEKSSEDSQEDRATEIREIVEANYSNLTELPSELTYVGPDRMISVRYKIEDGAVFYFVPRGSDLFELSYYHKSESDDDRLTNSNIFSSLVSGFRFTPYEESVEAETPEVSSEQVTFTSYRELESKTFQFKMSYPGNWYYSGSTTGYDFDDQAIEEGGEPILTLLLNQSETEGITRTGETVSVTVSEGDRTYTLTGPAEYENALSIMADSIHSTKDEASE